MPTEERPPVRSASISGIGPAIRVGNALGVRFPERCLQDANARRERKAIGCDRLLEQKMKHGVLAIDAKRKRARRRCWSAGSDLSSLAARSH
jgi:hypothetical protein